MATTLLRRGGRRPAPGPRSESRSFRSRIDAFTDALTPRALSQRAQAVQRKIGLTRGGQIALVAAVFVWAAAYVIAGTAMFLFAYGALLLVVLGLVIAPRNLKLSGERAGLYPRAQEGDRLDVEVQLTARRRVGTFVLEEQVPDRLGKRVRVPISKLSSGATVSHYYGLRCSRRGVYNVGPLIAVASDPLGIAERETVVAEPFELLVHPRVEFVSDRPLTRQYEDPPMRPPVSKPWPSGLEFYGMREYSPGDDLRRIVWRASARTGKIMVREAEQGVTDKVVIMLDTDRGAHSRDEDGSSESFETAIRAVASLGVHHLRDGYEVRTETNAGPLTRPLRGITNQLMLLDALSRLELSRSPLTEMIMRLVVRPQRDAHTILITPRLGPAEAGQLRLLLNTGMSVMVMALLWDEEETETVATAAALGCQVVGVHPGQDLATALAAGIGVGVRT